MNFFLSMLVLAKKKAVLTYSQRPFNTPDGIKSKVQWNGNKTLTFIYEVYTQRRCYIVILEKSKKVSK